MEEICLRDKIGEFLCEFAREDKRIYVIDSDLAKSTKTIEFQKEFPERFVETGIAEASAMQQVWLQKDKFHFTLILQFL